MKLLTGIVCLILVTLAYSAIWFYMRPSARKLSKVSQPVSNQDILSPFCTSVQKSKAYLSEIDDYIGNSAEDGIAKHQQELLRELVTSHTLICKLISRLIKTGIPQNVTLEEPPEKPEAKDPVAMQYSAQQVIPVVRQPLTGWHYGVGHVSKAVPAAPVQIPVPPTADRNRGKYHPQRFVNYKRQPRHPTPKQVCHQKLSYAQVKSHGADCTLTKMCPARAQTHYVGASYKIPPHKRLLIDTERAGRTPAWRLPPKPQSMPMKIADSVPDKIEEAVQIKAAEETKPHVTQVPIINKTDNHQLPSGDDTIWHILFDRLEKITGNIVQLQIQMKEYDIHTYLSRKVSTDLLNELLQRYLKQTDMSKFDKTPLPGDKASTIHKSKIVPQKQQKPGSLKTPSPQTTGVPPKIQKTSISQQNATNKLIKTAPVRTKATTGQQKYTSAKPQAAVPQKATLDNDSSTQAPPSSAKQLPKRESDRVDHILRQGRPRRNVKGLLSWQKWVEKFGNMRKEVAETSTFCAAAVASLERRQMEACKTKIGMSPGMTFGLATTISISVLASVALAFRLYTKISQASKSTSHDQSYHDIDKASQAVPDGNIAVPDRKVPALVDSKIKLDLCVLGISSTARNNLEPLIRRVFGSDYKLAESENSFYTVENFADIASIPDARMYAIGIELPPENREHILEDEALGKRSLKFKTVDKLLNTGADVALICIGDPGSQRLPKGKCYNRLTVQYDHNFLVRSLCRNERLFTINKDFTPSQVSRLRDWVAKGLATKTI